MYHRISTFGLKILLPGIFLGVFLCLNNCVRKHTPPLPALVDFNFDVKPILVQKCYLCHGPDSSGRKGGLRLDTFDGATATLKEGGSAIIPGHPGDSKLIFRINSDDPEVMMPPRDQTFTDGKRNCSAHEMD